MNSEHTVRWLRASILPLGDVAIFNAAFWLAYSALGLAGHSVSLDTYREVLLWTWILPPLVFYLSGLYASWDEYAFAKGMDSILTGVAVALVLLLVVIWCMRDRLVALQEFQRAGVLVPKTAQELVWGFPTRVLALVLVLAPLLLWGWRVLANALEYRWIGWSAQPRTALIVGHMDASDLARLCTSRRPVYRVAGYLDDQPDAAMEQTLSRLGARGDLRSVLEAREIDEVFLQAAALKRTELLDAVDVCFACRVRTRLVLGVYETLLAAAQPRLQGRIPLFSFRSGGIQGWNLVIKRIIDVVVSAAGLLLAAPLLLVAGIAIVVESKGWPVFSQVRIGQSGRRFHVYKLRTMVVDADVRGGPLTADDDPRITRVGAFLRRTSIDELPQLWNVFRGDMSLVGPRAVIPYVAEGFADWERLSLTVKPGITGLAQVSGRDEIGFREKSLLNLYYVRNYSIWLDLRILFDTVGVVLSMEGTGGTRGAA